MGRLYHLGCGDQHLDGYVNVDVRETPAVDLVADLNELVLPNGDRADGFFSSAFFEHLRRDARVGHLTAARNALTDDGFVCYIGLPDFEQIARLYLEQGPGIMGPVFDLYNVYRYTHGDPDDADVYLAQLHKSLFDVAELDGLLTEAGFASYVMFSYVYVGERVAVSLGFYAVDAQRSEAELQSACREFLAQFDGRMLEGDTLTFLGARSRAPLQTSVAASRWRRGASRIAHKVAVRLARV
jgi:predicted SAM-dependent methyltransferase